MLNRVFITSEDTFIASLSLPNHICKSIAVGLSYEALDIVRRCLKNFVKVDGIVGRQVADALLL